MLRKNKARFASSLILFSLLSAAAHAKTETQVVVAPRCLIQNLETDYKILSSTPSFSLLETNEKGIEALAEEKAKARTVPCGGFMNVTEAWQSYNAKHAFNSNNAKQFLLQEIKQAQPSSTLKKANYEIKYEKEVKQLLQQLNPDMMMNHLTQLSAFPDRYAGSDHGVKTAQWITQYLMQQNRRHDVMVYDIPTSSLYKQPSVVLKIGEGTNPGIVIGAHMDTLRANFSGNKPGADDDGSGSVTLLEIARLLLNSNMTFNKPIYLIWYSAEEMGLVGSSRVVSEFKNKKIPIYAVIQFDMTGFAYRKESTIWLMRDYVNKDLTAYLETLVNTYVKQPVKYTACGYACSDHASWTKGGFAAAMPAEAAFENSNPSIHTAQDTIEKLSKEHLSDYAKLGIAFAVELAEPKA